MHYSLFLIDYRKFRKRIDPLLERADIGDHSPIFNEASRIVKQTDQNSWILEGHGTRLLAHEELKSGNAQVGHAILIIMSGYLSPVQPSDRKLDMNALGAVLKSFGWDTRESRLLTEGLSIYSLLKPDEIEGQLFRPLPSDHRWDNPDYYWWWARPLNAFRTGWWNEEALHILKRKLLATKDVLENTNSSLTIQLDDMSMPRRTFDNYFSMTLDAFDKAMKEAKGLFYVVS